MINTNQKINIEKINDEKHFVDIALFEPKIYKGAEVIKQFIETILDTRKDSLFFEDFGFNLEDYLFDLPDDFQAEVLKDAVIRAIKAYFPQVELDEQKSSVEINYTQDNRPIYILKLIVISPEELIVNKVLGGNLAKGISYE